MTDKTRQKLASVDLFHGFNDVQVAHLTSIMKETELKAETYLFSEGDRPDCFYVITKGRIRISKALIHGGEELLAFLDEGGYFGEMELVDPTLRRAANAVAHEDCVLQAFPLEEFHALLNSDIDLAVSLLWNIAATLSQRLRETNGKIEAMFALAGPAGF